MKQAVTEEECAEKVLKVKDEVRDLVQVEVKDGVGDAVNDEVKKEVVDVKEEFKKMVQRKVISNNLVKSGEKPHRCDECGKRFSRYGALTAH